MGRKSGNRGGGCRVTTKHIVAAGYAMKCFECHWVGQSSLYITNMCISHLVGTQFVVLKAMFVI